MESARTTGTGWGWHRRLGAVDPGAERAADASDVGRGGVLDE